MKFDTLDEAILKACAGYARAITDLTFELKMPRAKVARRVASSTPRDSRRGPALVGLRYISCYEHRAGVPRSTSSAGKRTSVRTVLRAVGSTSYPKREDYPDEWEFEQTRAGGAA